MMQVPSLSQFMPQEIRYIFFRLMAPISSNRLTIRYTVAAPMEGSTEAALQYICFPFFSSPFSCFSFFHIFYRLALTVLFRLFTSIRLAVTGSRTSDTSCTFLLFLPYVKNRCTNYNQQNSNDNQIFHCSSFLT